MRESIQSGTGETFTAEDLGPVVKPGRKWWRFPGENPGENGSAHACSSMKSEDGALAPFHRLCRGAPKCEVTWRIGKRFASRSW